MGKKSIIEEKSYSLAKEIILLYQKISLEKKEFILTKQVLRSGTSIGANIREAKFAQSTSDFIHKMSIARKECNETLYWLELLKDCHYMNENTLTKIYEETVEVLKILSSIILTTKASPQSSNK